jgi:Cytochrome P450
VDAAGRADASDIGSAYSVRMICRLLNFPESDWERLAAWSDAAVQLPTTAAMTELERIETALRELRAYTTEQIERIRERPGDDLGSRLLAARDEGDSLSPQELVELFESLLMAGAETTKTVLALALWLFMKHADQWAALRADPALVPSAVEEVLRFRIRQLGIGRFRTRGRRDPRHGHSGGHIRPRRHPRGQLRLGGLRRPWALRHPALRRRRPRARAVAPDVRLRRACLRRRAPGAPRAPGGLRGAVTALARPGPRH